MAGDIAVIIGVLLIMGALPFAMERLDRSMNEATSTWDRRHRWRHRH